MGDFFMVTDFVKQFFHIDVVFEVDVQSFFLLVDVDFYADLCFGAHFVDRLGGFWFCQVLYEELSKTKISNISLGQI